MDQFHLVKLLGEGTFGTVWRMDWVLPSGHFVPVALKRIRMEPEPSFPEHELVANCNHPNVIKLYDSFYSYNKDGEGHLNLIFEFVSGSNLADVIDQVGDRMARESVIEILHQLLKAVAYLHARSIIHRDLKPMNVMLRDDGHVKLIDFGHAKYLSDREGSSETYSACYCVSRYYRAPELLLGNVHYGVKSDIWSVGCILAELLLGEPLFPGEDDEDQLLRIVTIMGELAREDVRALAPHHNDERLLINTDQPVIAPIPMDIVLPEHHKEFSDILSRMLVYDPDERWSAENLLEHPIFHGV